MEKVFGATERHDQLITFNNGKAMLIFGYGEENGNGYDYRQQFNNIPTKHELKEIIEAHVNSLTDERILSGYVWRNNPVWLSSENQFNFKAAYDLAYQTNGASLPAKYKLGEDAQGNPIYYDFIDLATFQDFYFGCVGWIQRCINDGWDEKDSVDYDDLLAN